MRVCVRVRDATAGQTTETERGRGDRWMSSKSQKSQKGENFVTFLNTDGIPLCFVTMGDVIDETS